MGIFFFLNLRMPEMEKDGNVVVCRLGKRMSHVELD